MSLRLFSRWLVVLLLSLGNGSLVGCGGGPAAADAPPIIPTAPPSIPMPVPSLRSSPVPTSASTPVLAPTLAPTPTVATVLPVIPITIGEHTLQAEVVSTFATRAQGLMYREELADDQGMLFVFADDQMRNFWMRNTRIPLSIAYLDADQRIINILDMEPFDESLYPSAAPARYALEVNQGWFEARGIVADDLVKFTLPDDLLIE